VSSRRRVLLVELGGWDREVESIELESKMNNMKTVSKLLSTMVASLGAWTSMAAYAVNDLPGGPAVRQLNLHPAATKIAEEQGWLHWFMIIICTVIFVLVFGVMAYSLLKHRKSVGHKAQELPEPIWVEIGWTVVPFIIVILMALPATKAVVAQKDTTNSDITIKATGYQWKWGYDYIKGEGEGISFISTLDNNHRIISDSGNVKDAPDNYLLKVDNAVVVPVGKKVRVITTANDVIHAWMIPAFGVKQDAIPGFVRDTWFRAERTGDFYGQCAELCGKEHAYMPIHVKVVTADEYTKWVDAEKKKLAAKADDPSKVWTLDDLAKRGEKVYAANCAACHQANGKGAGPIKPVDGSAIVLDADKNKQIAVLLNGAAGGAMPAWKQLNDTELAAVITYTKNNWSNKTGQVVQPADVKAARK
jgi:cytochrome c oxidase subunit II